LDEKKSVKIHYFADKNVRVLLVLRENKEMNNFINLLDNTLKMNSEIDKSDEEELTEVPVDQLRPLTAPGSRQNGQVQCSFFF
jgi:hypothetical protein